MADFLDAVSYAKLSSTCNEMPTIETSRKILEHYLRGQEIKEFIFQGVRVCETGTSAAVIKRDSMLVEEKLFGGTASENILTS